MPPLRPDRSSKLFNRALGAEIQAVRLRRQLSQKNLARLLSLATAASVSKYEAGTHPPTVRTLHRMAQVFGVPVDTLLPELTFEVEYDRILYQFFRGLWFLSAETRQVLATLLSSLTTVRNIAPLSLPTRPSGGGHGPSPR